MKFKVVKFKNVESTNDEAIKLIKKKNFNSIIYSDTQKNGRGTMGKKWISIKGNLFISLFFELKNKNYSFDFFSLINPYIIQNILKIYSNKKIQIKKPNDLLINKKKICGILQEVIEFKKKKYLIVGIGINTIISPKNKDFNSTNLQIESVKKIKNIDIMKNIKQSYEELLSDISKYKFTHLIHRIKK